MCGGGGQLKVASQISVPESLYPVFAKASPKRSFSLIENERFGLVFAKTGSVNSDTDNYCRYISLITQTSLCAEIDDRKRIAWSTEAVVLLFVHFNLHQDNLELLTVLASLFLVLNAHILWPPN
jgi:hypothetical protein